ncbi:MAG TPA: hypothetical protein VGA40_01750 [Candidatus Acidoferrales bacterium]
MAPNTTEPGNGTQKHETRDVSISFFAKVLLGLVAVTLLGMSVSLWYFRAMDERYATTSVEPPPLAGALPRLPPEPRLQVAPKRDMERFHAQEEAALESYAWVDRNTGVVRIPIERAIEIVAERGLPARPAPREGTQGEQ